MKIYLLTLLAYSLALVFAQNENCKILLLQSGSEKGAYQAGALKAFSTYLGNDMGYDVISGVNIGAVNAFFVSLFSQGEESQMADFLLQLWRNLNSSSIYQEWPVGLIDGLFDLSPFGQYLNQFDDLKVKRPFYTGVVNFNNGSFVAFTSNQSRENLKTILTASIAAPLYFPYVMFEGLPYNDGSIINTINGFDPISDCRNKGYSDNNIVVDAILTSGKTINKTNFTTGDALGMGLRGLELLLWQESIEDMFYLLQDFPDVNFRYIVMPEEELSLKSRYPYNATPEEIENFINIGYQSAYNSIQVDPKVSVEYMRNLFAENYEKKYRNGKKIVVENRSLIIE